MSPIIDYLHTTTHACSRALNTEMYTCCCRRRRLLHSSTPPLLPCLFFLLASPSNTHRLTLSHTCSTSVFTVHQCISVNQQKRERWESPCEHVTLTEIWPLSHPSSRGCVRIQQLRKRQRREKSGFDLQVSNHVA